ncbi:hypothetical protein F444_14795 [Phytophthora nicotianae P1976]|uniref:Uncharacterized protein n=1 Tax=Phytophthora nicotianae P1976 TaxID=1317066 RepID=A0A080ZNY7_PHYNI|nr:hypothetical protein F444_14795 [Phytophthora nicotianae P1976]
MSISETKTVASPEVADKLSKSVIKHTKSAWKENGRTFATKMWLNASRSRAADIDWAMLPMPDNVAVLFWDVKSLDQAREVARLFKEKIDEVIVCRECWMYFGKPITICDALELEETFVVELLLEGFHDEGFKAAAAYDQVLLLQKFNEDDIYRCAMITRTDENCRDDENVRARLHRS